MQEYRVNYTLLIGLLIGSLVTSGAVYGLWRFQIERKSDVLLVEAEKAAGDGKVREAVRHYARYLTIHGDDDQTRLKLAQLYVELIEQDDVEIEEIGQAMHLLEGTFRRASIRQFPESRDVQKRLAELYGRFRRFQDALATVDEMLLQYPDDSELQVLRADFLIRASNFNEAINYCYKLIGYDRGSDTFDADEATAPREPAVYSSLAQVLRNQENNPTLADRVMDQMIEANPDSADAYLRRGQYYVTFDDPERGQDDIERAYALDPEDASVLLVIAERAMRDERLDEAREYLAQGKKLHPDDTRFYQAAAGVELEEEDYEGAMAQVDEGLKIVSGRKALNLLFIKADFQANANDIEGVRQTLATMREAGFPTVYLDWFEARIKLAEGKWYEASEDLNRLRTQLSDMAIDLSQQIDLFLGLCYERLGQLERASEAYMAVLRQNPQDERAILAKQRVDARRGVIRSDEGGSEWQKALAEELAKPAEDRDWSRIDQMAAEIADERELSEADRTYFRANMMLMREDYAAARDLLREADRLMPNNLQIHRMAVEVARRDPNQGPEVAMRLLDKVVEEFGDQPLLRLVRADILISMQNEQLRPQLVSLLTGIDDWSERQKVALWTDLAARFLNLGMRDDARRCFQLAAELQPHELPTRMALFALALDEEDDEAMREAQDMILAVVRDKADSTWLYAEARRRLVRARRDGASPAALREIRNLITEALKQRSEWHELHLVLAELELLAGNSEAALASFEKAVSLGRPYPRALEQHVRLLVTRGQFARAQEVAELMPARTRQVLLGQLYTEILFRTDQVAQAIDEARGLTESNPDNWQNQFWYSQLLARSAQSPGMSEADRRAALQQAISAAQRAVELQSESPDVWYGLIAYHMLMENRDEAYQTLREAQLALSVDQLPLFLAKAYEAMGRWFDAETMYRAVHEANPNDMARVQQLAAFYMGNVYQQPDKVQRATPLVNQILRAGADGSLAADDANLLWARRSAARILAATQDYQQLRKAENLLASNTQDGILPLEDRLEMAQILAVRPEPELRMRALKLLEEASSIQRLSLSAEITLGRLYYLVGDWRSCRSHMRAVIGRYRDSAEARAVYAKMILDRGDAREYGDAVTQVNQLKELAPNAGSTFELDVLVANKTGRQQEARANLIRRIPRVTNVEDITDGQAQLLGLIARLLVELEDLDGAEQIYRRLAAREPRRAFALALFLGTHRDVEQCFEQLQTLYTPDRVGDVLQVATTVLRTRRDEIGDTYDEHVQRWFDRALRESPDSVALWMAQGDFYDLQGRYDEAKTVYRKLLDDPALTGIGRAIVLNNLAYLVALAGSTSTVDVDPLVLVQEAADILGPTADILDTRAVVLTARGQYRQAIEDLTLSVTDNPTASKYFHKAVAHYEARQYRDAVDAWNRAEELGLTRAALNRLEHGRYEEMQARMDELTSRATDLSLAPTR